MNKEIKDFPLPTGMVDPDGKTYYLYTFNGRNCKTIHIKEDLGYYEIATYHMVRFTEDDNEESKKNKHKDYLKQRFNQGQICNIITVEEFINIYNKALSEIEVFGSEQSVLEVYEEDKDTVISIDRIREYNKLHPAHTKTLK
jgi:hypothetical protein